MNKKLTLKALFPLNIFYLFHLVFFFLSPKLSPPSFPNYQSLENYPLYNYVQFLSIICHSNLSTFNQIHD